MKISVWMMLAVAAVALPLAAQQDNRVDYPQLGLSFEVPAGWIGQEAEGMYLMGHNSIPGMVFILPHDRPLTSAQIAAEARQGLDFGGGTVLQLSGSQEELASGAVGGQFRGIFEFSPAAAYVAGLPNPHGNGLTVIAITSAAAFVPDTYRDLALQVAGSVRFREAAAPSADDWKGQLSGTKLTWMESYYSGGDIGGGYNMKTEIHLCPAGHFLYYDQSTVAAGGDYSSALSAGKSNGHGSWQVVKRSGTVLLELHFNQSGVKAYRLEWGPNKELMLDGRRYYRTWEGEHAPDCF